MNAIWISSFGRAVPVTVITHWGDISIAYGRNPYGTHNLLILQDEQAIRHGNCRSAAIAFWRFLPRKRYIRLWQFCKKKGIELPPWKPTCLVLP
jgi:hypothetical protein